MFIFGGMGLAGIVLVGLWVFAIFDVISTPDGATRNLPKMVWLLIVFALPDIGAIAWLLLGRPTTKAYRFDWEPSSYGESGAVRRERINQELTRSEELNERLLAWERDQAAAKAHEQRVADLDTREAVVERREIEAERRRLAEWEARLQAREGGDAG